LIAFLFTCGKDAISRSDCRKGNKRKNIAAAIDYVTAIGKVPLL
jgi:hypothetical protein